MPSDDAVRRSAELAGLLAAARAEQLTAASPVYPRVPFAYYPQAAGYVFGRQSTPRRPAEPELWRWLNGVLEQAEGEAQAAGAMTTLSLVRAHRTLLAWHEPHWPGYGERLTCDGCERGTSCGCCSDTVAWPCPEVRVLASAWSHLPGWQRDWAWRPGDSSVV